MKMKHIDRERAVATAEEAINGALVTTHAKDIASVILGVPKDKLSHHDVGRARRSLLQLFAKQKHKLDWLQVLQVRPLALPNTTLTTPEA